MDNTSEDTTDEELADLMADPEAVEQSDDIEGAQVGSVEVGIPPILSDESTEVDSSEESFSINDFEEDFHPDKSETPVDEPLKVENENEENETPHNTEEAPVAAIVQTKLPTSRQNGDGDVAQFRQTLASLSRQLELDRLAFLHKSLEDSGENLPSLNDIASDISGDKLIKPPGDCDLYDKRPTARLEGWISGLSFGVSKRAKKFTK